MENRREIKMSKESMICPGCNVFLGEPGDLEKCPLCGYDLINAEGEE